MDMSTGSPIVEGARGATHWTEVLAHRPELLLKYSKMLADRSTMCEWTDLYRMHVY
jgi:hypothetical protein